MDKITIVGAGNVGSQAAFYAAIRELGDIAVIDIVEGMPQGKALDISHSMPIVGSNVRITGSNDYKDSHGSDIVIITAGVPRKPGMSRDDLIGINAKIIRSIVPEVVRYSPDCILIVLTNPLDAMVHLAYDISGFPKNRVIGMAGVLDTSRFKAAIAHKLHGSVNEVEAMVLGGHGDSMVPLIDYCTFRGNPIRNFLSEHEVDELVKKVQNGGAEIVSLLKTGSAFFAPGLSVIEMAESILKDKKKVLPCSVLLEGEYGVDSLFVGVPAILGRNGVEGIVELPLSDEERQMFDRSVGEVRKLVSLLK